MIYFFNEDVALPSLDFDATSNWLNKIASDHNIEIENINYVFCSDDYLLKINQEHLDHDYFTDIITFPLQKDPIISDIFISVDRVKDNSKKIDLPFAIELKRVIVHGLLHLIGYDDKSEELKLKMRAAEDKYLELY